MHPECGYLIILPICVRAVTVTCWHLKVGVAENDTPPLTKTFVLENIHRYFTQHLPLHNPHKVEVVKSSLLKVLSLQNELKLYLPIFLVDDVLDMLSSIYDSIWSIKHGSVVFFWVKTSATHYQRGGLLTKWMFIYVFIPKQSIQNGYFSVCQEMSNVY